MKTEHSLRLRYIIGLSAIALLVTASYITMQRVVSDQRDFARLVNMAGHQSGLANRIAYFSTQMAMSGDDTEYEVARSQIGRTANRMEANHQALRNGSVEDGIPLVSNENLKMIYEDPMVGLDRALENFLEKARSIYDRERQSFSTNSADYLFLTTYGPHALEPMFDIAVEEYENISRQAIMRIEKLELAIWVTAIIILFLEVTLIFRPLEKRVSRTLGTLKASIAELTSTRQRLEAAQKLASVGDWQYNVTLNRLTCSDQVCEIYGVDKKEKISTWDSFFRLVHPEDRGMVRSSMDQSVMKRQAAHMEFRILRPDGSEALVYQQVAVCNDAPDGQFVLAGTVQDITERKELSSRLEKLSDNLPGFLYLLHQDLRGKYRFRYVSKGVYETLGILPDGKFSSMLKLVPATDRDGIRERLSESSRKLEVWHDHYMIVNPRKGNIFVESHATPERLSDGSTLWYGYVWDITDRKLKEDRIRKLAYYDSLTGLVNRRKLKQKLDRARENSVVNRHFCALFMLDMDNFKTLNDTKGHNVGDALLVEVGERLGDCIRESDTAARLGGDEFVVLIEWLDEDGDRGLKKAETVVEKIRLALSKPYVLASGSIVHHASASIGAVLFRGDELSGGELLKRADVAMFEAKELGRNRVCFFSEKRQNVINEQTALVHGLRKALDEDRFSLYFQPQITGNGRVCGAEVLLRWFLPDGESISPARFIPVAEETGLIIPIGEWVLKSSYQIMEKLIDYDLQEDFALAINISARQFSDEYFLDKVKSVINNGKVEPGRLKFELTETSLFKDFDRSRAILTSLREMGIRIELDDFGTGYSSLNSLKVMPFDTLKLDGTLTRGIDDGSEGKAIVRAAIGMAKALSMKIVAEGVETAEQRDFMVKEGCDILQGFFYSRPLPYEDFIQFLQHGGEKSSGNIPHVPRRASTDGKIEYPEKFFNRAI